MKKIALILSLFAAFSLDALHIKNDLKQPIYVSVGFDPDTEVIDGEDERDFSHLPEIVSIHIFTDFVGYKRYEPQVDGNFYSEISGNLCHFYGTVDPDAQLETFLVFPGAIKLHVSHRVTQTRNFKTPFNY